MQEKAILFGTTYKLVGITSLPENINSSVPAIVFLNAGLVHRIGQNRLYVKIARSLAKLGFVCMRFDLSGIGDSPSNSSETDFHKRTIVETQEALNYINNSYHINKFVLIGSCSGAISSINSALADERVVGTVLINSSSPSLFRFLARQYIYNKNALAKIPSFNINFRQILKNLSRKISKRNLPRKSDVQNQKPIHHIATVSDIVYLSNRDVKLNFICCQHDPSLDYLSGILKKAYTNSKINNISTEIILDANHSLFPIKHQNELIKKISTWVKNTFSANATIHQNFQKEDKFYKKYGFFRNLKRTH